MLTKVALIAKPPHHGTMKASLPFPCLFPRSFLTLALAAVLLAFSAHHAGATSVAIPTQECGLSAQVDADSGAYRIDSARPAWSLAGSLNVRLQNVATSHGDDELGDYQQLAFDWQSGPGPMSAWIRVYRGKPLVLFSQTCRVASEMPPAAFPAFTRLPAALHIFSYEQSTFSPPAFAARETSTPWLLFDDDANALILSPASNFMVASMVGDGRGHVAIGFNPNLRNLPAGFTQQGLVAFGRGINRTWDLWGGALRDLGHAKRPGNDADAVLKYLGYWTDNGAVYYYHYDPAKGYAGTLQSLVEHYRKEQIPIRYLQLDSWWYYKSTTDADGKPGSNNKNGSLPAGEWNRYGGLLEYRAHADLFPNGLDAFQKSIGLPLVTHNRWIDPASPYHANYRISGVAVVDPKWWDDIARYLKTSGVVTYEQDWLDRIYKYSPAFSSDRSTGQAFLDQMARACRERGITMQYCMPYPCFFLQGSRYENLTTIRTSDDRFNSDKWHNFLYTSRLASSAGVWPWADVYLSTEINNVLLSTLSAGPVGIGDAIGAEDKANLLRAVRADGVIVKPDASIVPLDRSYIADAQRAPAPLMASTYTDRDGVRTGYLFAFNRPQTQEGDVRFSLTELGLGGPAYVFDYFSGAGTLLQAEGVFSAPLGRNASAFYVIAPVGRSGIALLGDKGKFVGTGKQRIASLRDEAGRLTIGIIFAENESAVVLNGYSAIEPRITVISGAAGILCYDPASRYFSVDVQPDMSAPLDTSAPDPVRRLTVLLETPQK
jgi:hypothetical protein